MDNVQKVGIAVVAAIVVWVLVKNGKSGDTNQTSGQPVVAAATPSLPPSVFVQDYNTMPNLVDEKWVYDYCYVKALGEPDPGSPNASSLIVYRQVKELIGSRIVVQFDIDRDNLIRYNCPYAEKSNWTKYGVKSERFFQSGGPAWEGTVVANFPNTSEVRKYFCENTSISRIKVQGLLSDVSYGSPNGEVICQATLDDCKILH